MGCGSTSRMTRSNQTEAVWGSVGGQLQPCQLVSVSLEVKLDMDVRLGSALPSDFCPHVHLVQRQSLLYHFDSGRE